MLKTERRGAIRAGRDNAGSFVPLAGDAGRRALVLFAFHLGLATVITGLQKSINAQDATFQG